MGKFRAAPSYRLSPNAALKQPSKPQSWVETMRMIAVKNRKLAAKIIASIIILAIVCGFVYLTDDDLPVPTWIQNLQWTLSSQRTKGKNIALLGDAYFNQGNYDHAILLFKESLQYYPECGATHYDLGMAFFKQGRILEACAQWKKVEEADEEFVSDDVREDLQTKSRDMLKRCHQEVPPATVVPRSLGYDF